MNSVKRSSITATFLAAGTTAAVAAGMVGGSVGHAQFGGVRVGPGTPHSAICTPYVPGGSPGQPGGSEPAPRPISGSGQPLVLNPASMCDGLPYRLTVSAGTARIVTRRTEPGATCPTYWEWYNDETGHEAFDLCREDELGDMARSMEPQIYLWRQDAAAVTVTLTCGCGANASSENLPIVWPEGDSG